MFSQSFLSNAGVYEADYDTRLISNVLFTENVTVIETKRVAGDKILSEAVIEIEDMQKLTFLQHLEAILPNPSMFKSAKKRFFETALALELLMKYVFSFVFDSVGITELALKRFAEKLLFYTITALDSFIKTLYIIKQITVSVSDKAVVFPMKRLVDSISAAELELYRSASKILVYIVNLAEKKAVNIAKPFKDLLSISDKLFLNPKKKLLYMITVIDSYRISATTMLKDTVIRTVDNVIMRPLKSIKNTVLTNTVIKKLFTVTVKETVSTVDKILVGVFVVLKERVNVIVKSVFGWIIDLFETVAVSDKLKLNPLKALADKISVIATVFSEWLIYMVLYLYGKTQTLYLGAKQHVIELLDKMIDGVELVKKELVLDLYRKTEEFALYGKTAVLRVYEKSKALYLFLKKYILKVKQ